MLSLVEKPMLGTHNGEEGVGEGASFGGASPLQQLGEGLLTSAEGDCPQVLSQLGEPQTRLRAAAHHPAGSPKGVDVPAEEHMGGGGLAWRPWSPSLQAGVAVPVQLFPSPSCAFTSPFLWDRTPRALHPGRTDSCI